MHQKPNIQDYNAIVGHYMAYFIQKQFDLEENQDVDYYWVADMIGTIVSVNDFFLNFDDIRYDIDSEQPKGLIFEWYDYMMEQHELNPTSNINYTTYSKGIRL